VITLDTEADKDIPKLIESLSTNGRVRRGPAHQVLGRQATVVKLARILLGVVEVRPHIWRTRGRRRLWNIVFKIKPEVASGLTPNIALSLPYGKVAVISASHWLGGGTV
jgi:hypothetical protein